MRDWVGWLGTHVADRWDRTGEWAIAGSVILRTPAESEGLPSPPGGIFFTASCLSSTAPFQALPSWGKFGDNIGYATPMSV